MSELPDGWKYSTLEELGLPKAITVDPRAFPNETFELYSVPSYYSGYPEIAKGGDIGSTKQLVQPGDVLLCKIVPHLVRVWVVPERKMHRQIASGEWILVRPSLCNTGYIRRLLMEPAFRDRFMETVSGVGGSLLRARPKAVSQIPIPIAPKNEQNRIAMKLDSLFERTHRAREELSHIPRLIENYKKAILEAAFDDAATCSEAMATLGDIASEVRNGLSKKPHDMPPGTPILRISSVRSLTVHLNDRRYYPVTEEIADNTYLRNGDLLFTRYNGNPDLVAVCGQIRGLSEALVYPDKLIRVRICNDDISQDYIEIICAASQSRQWFAPHIKTAAGQHGISGKDLKRLPIPLAKRRDQDRIVSATRDAMQAIGNVDSELQQAIRLVDHLDRANLAKAFRGELVPQDPNDEPASALLERIRLERVPKAKGRRSQTRKNEETVA